MNSKHPIPNNKNTEEEYIVYCIDLFNIYKEVFY